MVDLDLTLNLKLLDDLTKELEKELQAVIRKTGFFIERKAKQYAPVDTGNLRNSIYTIAKGSNRYGLVSFAAAKRGSKVLPQAEPPADKYEVVVAAGAEYAINVEYGHFAVRGNTKEIGVRAGRIGVRVEPGVIATYVPGYLFFADARRDAKPFLEEEARKAVERAKRVLE